MTEVKDCFELSSPKILVEKQYDKQDNVLDKLRSNNVNRLIIGHLNINSVRNKFEMLQEVIRGKLDIFLISETKLDDSFPISQFLIDGYSPPFRLDRNGYGGGLLLFVREDIPSKTLTEYKNKNGIENMFLEINLRSKKWLLSCSYNPNASNIKDHLEYIGKGITHYSTKYENFFLMEDFNMWGH